MDEMTSLEVRALEAAIESGRKVKLFTVNGYMMVGTVKDFDCNVIVLEAKGAPLMVYRHAVSTIYLEGC